MVYLEAVRRAGELDFDAVYSLSHLFDDGLMT
jgi:hypothetical protein